MTCKKTSLTGKNLYILIYHFQELFVIGFAPLFLYNNEASTSKGQKFLLTTVALPHLNEMIRSLQREHQVDAWKLSTHMCV